MRLFSGTAGAARIAALLLHCCCAAAVVSSPQTLRLSAFLVDVGALRSRCCAGGAGVPAQPIAAADATDSNCFGNEINKVLINN